MEDLVTKLHSIGAIKFGAFPLKRNFIAPFQVDLSLAISHADVAKQIATLLWKKVEVFPHELLCGVPAMGSCLATYLAWTHDHPLIMRQEKKESAPQILGHYKTGQRCLVDNAIPE